MRRWTFHLNFWACRRSRAHIQFSPFQQRQNDARHFIVMYYCYYWMYIGGGAQTITQWNDCTALMLYCVVMLFAPVWNRINIHVFGCCHRCCAATQRSQKILSFFNIVLYDRTKRRMLIQQLHNNFNIYICMVYIHICKYICICVSVIERR